MVNGQNSRIVVIALILCLGVLALVGIFEIESDLTELDEDILIEKIADAVASNRIFSRYQAIYLDCQPAFLSLASPPPKNS